MRPIDADALREGLRRFFPVEVLEGIEPKTLFAQIMHDIDNAPTVPLPDFKEGYKRAIIDGKTNFSRPKGEWIKKVDKVGFISNICSNCGTELEYENPCQDHFCYNCGADMKGEKDETNI